MPSRVKGRLAWVTVGSALLGLTGALASVAVGQQPYERVPWLQTGGVEAAVVSVVLGLCVAGIMVVGSRLFVRRFAWARSLHGSLRPMIVGQGNAAIGLMAVASGFGEELFFRGFLAPLVGVVLSSVAFGLLHQVRGPARFAWTLWAAALGAVLALIYALTGTLLGPIVAHVVINAANLRYLRDTDLERAPRVPRLGGLLSRR
jgi:membrane protease YdiL (CAAX protease family)